MCGGRGDKLVQSVFIMIISQSQNNMFTINEHIEWTALAIGMCRSVLAGAKSPQRPYLGIYAS